MQVGYSYQSSPRPFNWNPIATYHLHPHLSSTNGHGLQPCRWSSEIRMQSFKYLEWASWEILERERWRPNFTNRTSQVVVLVFTNHLINAWIGNSKNNFLVELSLKKHPASVSVRQVKARFRWRSWIGITSGSVRRHWRN